MEATVLLKVLEETDRHTLSFDMDDFDFCGTPPARLFIGKKTRRPL